MIERPPLQYHGGKWLLASWIIRRFPPHHGYVEPYGGGASVLLRKPPSDVETYNDLDGDVVTFFRVLREQPEALVRAIQLTPWARAELKLARTAPPPDDPVEQARRLYVQAWQGFYGGRRSTHPGWRYCATVASNSLVGLWGRTEHLCAVAERLRAVQIECDDALAVIRRYDRPGTLFYVDPPYLPHVRGANRETFSEAYRHEMTVGDHAGLARVLRSVQGMVVLSGYASAEYAEWYETYGWQRYSRAAAKVNRNAAATECLWLSPAATAAQRQGVLL